MKKTVFILCLCLILSGCFSRPVPPVPTTEPTTQTTAQTSPQTETTVPYIPYQVPMISFSGAVHQEVHSGSNGASVTFLRQDMELLMEDAQVSEAVTLDFMNLTDFNNTSGPKLLRELQDSSENAQGALSLLYSVRRIDRNMLSLVFTQTVSGDDRSSSTVRGSVTYDLLSGRRVQLKDVLVPDFSAQALTDRILEALAGPAAEGQLYADHAYVIGELFSSNTPVKNWYLSEEGLCFYFAPYEIAPYSMGFITAVIPYSQLSGLLREACFPEEEIGLSGTVLLDVNPDALDTFSQFRELNLDPKAESWLLHGLGAVEGLRLETGSFHDGVFIPEGTVFACPIFSQGDALLLQATRERLQSLSLTYRTQGETVTVPLIHALTVN